MNEVIPSIELYDHDIFSIEKVLAQLNKKQHKSVNLEDFRREIIERFEDIGLVVNVKVYTTAEEGVFAFDIDIYDRCERKPFDYERQAHEVRNDILEIEPEKKGQIIKGENPFGN